MTKIVCLGAGSFSFGLSTLLTLLQSKPLQGSEICLVDIDQQALEMMTGLAKWLNEAWDSHKVISSYSQRKEALKDADFIVSAIETQPRDALWRKDQELTDRFGLRQPYGENGGPGGFAHAARNVNTLLEIAADVEALAPRATLINFTNPMHRVCYLLNEYTNVKTVGLCHQLAIGYAMVAKALAQEYDIEGAEEFLSTHADPANHAQGAFLAEQGLKKFKITAAGLNHFTWMLQVQDRATGEDLYPRFRAAWAKVDLKFEPLTRRVFDIFGLFPIPGDEHLCEYLPWMCNPQTKPWERFDLSLYNWELMSAIRDYQWEHVTDLVQSRKSLDMFEDPHSEGAVELIESLAFNQPLYWEAVNIPNQGLISGLTDQTIVELPATVNGDGIQGQVIGEMPKGITNLLQREALCSQLGIDAVVQGSRELALQSLLLDPVVNDIELAESILDEILLENKAYLPQFFD